ncbi:large ribosomal subunit protein mL53-like [Watersipora subatra]|uniref:large ribosomal subunit protein mL53-like n=1 Tax=Watersipora subatra TaxID=2589382 RepID=UPI00355BBBF4
MKYGFKYIPFVGRLSSFNTDFYNTLKTLQLNSVAKIDMKLDPFSGKDITESLRTFAFHIDTPKIRQTNYKCGVKLNFVCDRSEPQMHVKFNSGQKALLKTSNLNALEIAQEFKVLCDIQERKADEAQAKKGRR